MQPELLGMTDVSIGYGGQTVLEGVDLSIRQGEMVVIAGTSGCGKSTLLKTAVGLLKPAQGEVRLLGTPIQAMADEELFLLRTRVGFLFQGGALINSLTVAENIELPLRQFTRLPRGVVQSLVRMKLALVGLEEARQKMPPELSGGMRKRVALARALALDPLLLLCDEPSAGLDPVTAAALDALLMDLRATLGMTVVVVTHELGSIDCIADRVIMLSERRVIFDGGLKKAHESQLGAMRDFFERRPGQVEKRGLTIEERLRRQAKEDWT